jgi:hypothetical protein
MTSEWRTNWQTGAPHLIPFQSQHLTTIPTALQLKNCPSDSITLHFHLDAKTSSSCTFHPKDGSISLHCQVPAEGRLEFSVSGAGPTIDGRGFFLLPGQPQTLYLAPPENPHSANATWIRGPTS